MSALARWLERRELPVIDEATARERCSPLTDAEGNRERLITVWPQDERPLAELIEERSRLKRAMRDAEAELQRPLGHAQPGGWLNAC